jgi:eukaryotic-like serine/threonine-protein kinase
MNLEVGTQLGEYRILSRIGKGAYGIVFEAEHAITKRIDAVKLMLDAGPSAADEEHRFLREIQVQASLQHVNIATVYGAFRTPWGLALAMELVKGQSLRAILSGGPLSPTAAVAYLLQVLDGLSYAEQRGVVHRDIKPDNILITPDGTVKLTDFGLAQAANSTRITTSGENLGTPCYMSPEQVTGSAPADARSDVYSTGVVLYEAVTGRPPFLGTNGFAVMLAHQNTLPQPPVELEPSIAPQLNQVILKALEKDPACRFQDAAGFHEALCQAIVAVAAPAPPPTGRRVERGRIAVAAGVLVLAVCGFGAWANRFSAPRRDLGPPAALSHPIEAVPQAPTPPAALRDPVPPLTPARVVRRRRPAKPEVKQAVTTPTRIPAAHKVAAAPKTEGKPDRHPALPVETSLAPLLPRQAAAPLPAVITPPAPPEEPVQPKRPNIIRRALGRIFGRRARTSQSAAPPAAVSTKPGPD